MLCSCIYARTRFDKVNRFEIPYALFMVCKYVFFADILTMECRQKARDDLARHAARTALVARAGTRPHQPAPVVSRSAAHTRTRYARARLPLHASAHTKNDAQIPADFRHLASGRRCPARRGYIYGHDPVPARDRRTDRQTSSECRQPPPNTKEGANDRARTTRPSTPCLPLPRSSPPRARHDVAECPFPCLARSIQFAAPSS